MDDASSFPLITTDDYPYILTFFQEQCPRNTPDKLPLKGKKAGNALSCYSILFQNYIPHLHHSVILINEISLKRV
ncbi:phosphoribosylaminoimidazole-succinocarboxamide synthase [Desmospora sp. 8437]|nr:phosphoribosylaminoimidazole-succinocarboxamide synthase [Desmospora sp. 8437]